MASSSQKSSEIQELARFAVEEYNHKENGVLELVRVAKVESHSQVVPDTLHRLILEVMKAGKRMMYEAKVWVDPWNIDSKSVVEFKYVSVIRDVLEYRSVAVDDPIIVEAADRALMAMQGRSHSLVQLLQILNAKAEVTAEGVKYEMILKVEKGEKEEKMKLVFDKAA